MITLRFTFFFKYNTRIIFHLSLQQHRTDTFIIFQVTNIAANLYKTTKNKSEKKENVCYIRFHESSILLMIIFKWIVVYIVYCPITLVLY